MMHKYYLPILFSILMALPVQVKSQGAPGAIDRTFGTLGKVYTQVRPVTNHVNDLALQPDGKIVAVGSGSGMEVLRYTASGTLDTTFNGTGQAELTTGDALAVAIQPDGKIVVVGHNFPATNLDMKVVRYNANGTLDPTFDTDGIATLPIGAGTDIGQDVAIQPDGKILVAGRSDTPPTFATSYAIARFNANGSLDMSFGNNGVVIPSGNGQNFPHQLALQADGKFVHLQTAIVNGNQVLVMRRYNPSGQVDEGFGAMGTVTTGIGLAIEFAAVALQADGKIVVSCSSFTNASSYDFSLIRYNNDGSFDDTFGTGGIVTTPIGPGATLDQAKALVIQPNGKIVVGGRSPNGSNNNFVTVRYTRNGSVDPRWGVGGIAITDMGGPADGIHAMVIQPNGRVVVGGESDIGTPGTRKFALARYMGEGAENSDFDRDGSTDISVYRPSDGDWYILASSTGSLLGVHWGLPGDQLVPADYDGDLKADIAVWRSGATATLYVLNSSDNSVRVEQFGATGDDPSVVGDYDGDGQADPAVYRAGASPGDQSFFFYRSSFNNPNGDITYVPWGTGGDIAVRGDFSGDGRIDPTVFRPSVGTWFTVNVNDGNATLVRRWGLGTDRLVPADYTGDGKTDHAVFRDGVWYVLRSDSGSAEVTSWGLTSDKPIPADYNGDGQADIAIYRSGTWYILEGTTPRYVNFGLATDLPSPGAYMP